MKTENAKTENQLSVDENIIEAFFVFEKLEALLAASTETHFGKEESRCLIGWKRKK